MSGFNDHVGSKRPRQNTSRPHGGGVVAEPAERSPDHTLDRSVEVEPACDAGRDPAPCDTVAGAGPTCAPAPEPVTIVCNGTAVPRKYWLQRRMLWSRFAEAPVQPATSPATDAVGCCTTLAAAAPPSAVLADPGGSHPLPEYAANIRMDAEGWFSVTPEAIADGMAAALLRQIGGAPLAAPTAAGKRRRVSASRAPGWRGSFSERVQSAAGATDSTERSCDEGAWHVHLHALSDATVADPSADCTGSFHERVRRGGEGGGGLQRSRHSLPPPSPPPP
jgi:hypothetical protein